MRVNKENEGSLRQETVSREVKREKKRGRKGSKIDSGMRGKEALLDTIFVLLSYKRNSGVHSLRNNTCQSKV